jgi:hypothetical protein
MAEQSCAQLLTERRRTKSLPGAANARLETSSPQAMPRSYCCTTRARCEFAQDLRIVLGESLNYGSRHVAYLRRSVKTGICTFLGLGPLSRETIAMTVLRGKVGRKILYAILQIPIGKRQRTCC